MGDKKKEMRTIGRSQGGRPQAAPDAHKHGDGERILKGALSVPIEQVSPDPSQPRKNLDAHRMDELAASVSAYGILQPLVVREAGLLDDGRTRYMIVAGGRRHVAATRAGLTRVPVVVRESAGATLRVLQLTENLQREALAPVDEARAFRELMDLETIDTRAVALRIHRSHTYVADRLKLIAHEDVADAVARGVLTPSAAAEVAREKDAERRRQLIQQAHAAGLQKREVQQLRRSHVGAAAEVAGSIRVQPATSERETASVVPMIDNATPAATAHVATLESGIAGLAPTSAGRRAGLDTTASQAAELALLVGAAGGRAAVLDLLAWAVENGIALDDLRAQVVSLPAP